MNIEFEVVGKPNERGVEMLYDAVVRWVIAGRPTFTCRECRVTLSEAERQDGFCRKHRTTRKVFTYEDALRSAETGRRRGRKPTKGEMQ